MMKVSKRIILLLFIITNLFAHYIWSDPVIVTSHPTAQILDPEMFIDFNGTIHVIWNEVYESNLSQIYYSKSEDEGETWSAPFNVSQSDTSKLGDPAVGADYNGNVFVTYSWNYLGYPIMMEKKFDGVSWSEPARLDSNSFRFTNWYFNDNDGRLYHFWHQLGYTMYRYKEIDANNWSEINNSVKNIWIADITIDEENNLLCTGSKTYEAGYDQRTIFIKYSKPDDQWKEYTEIYSNYSCGVKICKSENNDIHIAMDVTNPSLVGYKPYYMKYQSSNTTWTEPENISDTQSNQFSTIFIDESNRLHIFLYFALMSGTYEYIKTDSYWHYYIYQYPIVCRLLKFINNDRLCSIYTYMNENDESSISFIKTTGVGIDDDNLTVKSISLSQNYPNPFNNSTIIKYELKELSDVQINIYNSKGEFISNPINCRQDKGYQFFEFKSDKLNSDIYFYQLIVNDRIIDTKKMLYLK